jgi:hypothetical protein
VIEIKCKYCHTQLTKSQLHEDCLVCHPCLRSKKYLIHVSLSGVVLKENIGRAINSNYEIFVSNNYIDKNYFVSLIKIAGRPNYFNMNSPITFPSNLDNDSLDVFFNKIHSYFNF